MNNPFEELLDLLESTDFAAAPVRLMPGSPLKIEPLDLSGMRMITLDPLYTHSRPVKMVSLKAEYVSNAEKEANMDFWKDNSK